MRHRLGAAGRAPWAAVALLSGAMLLGACANDDRTGADTTTENMRRDVGTATAELRERLDNAWASLRTDGERLIDQVQTRNDPQAKQNLLDRCRDAVAKLRAENADQAGRVGSFCDRIRDADPNDSDAWNAVKREFSEVRNAFR